MKKILLASLFAINSLGTAQSASVSGSTDFEVNIPEILVLYHWDKAHLDINGKNFVYNDKKTHTGSMTMGDATVTINENPLTGETPIPAGFDTSSLIDVKLEKSWAVRSISSSNVKLAIEIKNAEHKDTTKTSIATVSVAEVSEGDIPSKWTPTVGDITFKLDLSKVTKPGLHESENETFKLTLTGN